MILKYLSSLRRFGRFSIKRFLSTMDCKEKLAADKAECDSFVSLFGELKFQTHVSLRLFKIEHKSSTDQFCPVLERLEGHLETELLEMCRWIYTNAHQFDFEEHRANGLRSFMFITSQCCVTLLLQLRLLKNDSSYTNWRGSSLAELSAYVDCLGELRQCLFYITRFTDFASDGCLFPNQEVLTTPEFQALLDQSNNISQEVFYGRCIGFYYCASARRVLEVLACIMAGFSSTFKANKSGLGAFVNTVMNTMSSYWNQETRGQQIAYVTRHATVDFCKAFWSFNEHPLALHAPNMILPPVEIAINVEVPAIPFQLTVPRSAGVEAPYTVTVPAPRQRNKTEPNKIRLRITSLRRRKGMAWLVGEGPYLPRSPYLLLHVHGGGFVAQSSQAHDMYLRKWADELDCPIVSIDYSLAPEHPFPRALDECVYAYCWALKNARKLGSTGQRIVMCGDSAGGNLSLGCILRVLEMKVPPAHGLMVAYTPAHVSFMPSPSRLLSTMDPLLPVGILSRCLLAYAGIDEKTLLDSVQDSSTKDISSDDDPVSVVKSYSKQSSNASSHSSSTAKPWLSTLTKSQSTPNLMKHEQASLKQTSPVSITTASNGKSEDLTSPLLRVRHAIIPPDPFMSPLLASDDMLRQMPPVSIVACHLDPLLDDCIELAKRLSSLGNPVQVRVLDSVPHGFLNLVLVSKECNKGSEVCLDLIRQLFDMETSRDGDQATS